MWNRFAPRLRKTIILALEEPARAGTNEAGAEHLLSAIARESQNAASFILDYSGISKSDLLTAINPSNGRAASRTSRAERLTAHAMHILDVAVNEADKRKDAHVGTEHVLLALLSTNQCPVSSALISRGLNRATVERASQIWIDRNLSRMRQSSPLRRRSPFVSTLLKPVEKTARYASLGYRVFIQKSLGHPGFVANPYRLYHQLRERWPIRRDPIVPVWVMMRYDDILSTLRDPRFRKDPFLSDALPEPLRDQLSIPASPAPVDGEPLAMLFLDPPRHTRLRGQFNRAFTPRALNDLLPRIQQITDKRLDRAEKRGEMDIIADLAVPLPVCVIAELLGFLPEDYDRLKLWSDHFAAALTINPTPEQLQASAKSREELREYFDKIVADLREHPRDCLINTLLSSDNGEENLSHNELFANCSLLMAAGHETTTNLIGNGMLALLRNPDQLELLRSKPGLIESAVEEFLRFDGPVQWISRVANEEIEIGGQTIARGEIVLGSIGAANRDPSQFPDPDRLDITRPDNKHLAFGQGIHYCIGATLARMEAQIAIGTLVRRFPKIRLATRKMKWNKNIIFRGVKTLPVNL